MNNLRLGEVSFEYDISNWRKIFQNQEHTPFIGAKDLEHGSDDGSQWGTPLDEKNLASYFAQRRSIAEE